jgi:hypothetical protein
LRDDPDEFDARARSAYAACARRRCGVGEARRAVSQVDHAEASRPTRTPDRPATPRQLRALGALARSRGAKPDDLLAGHGLDAGTVSAAEASRLITDLRGAMAG